MAGDGGSWLKARVVPAILGALLGMTGGRALPQRVEVEPERAMELLEPSDGADLFVCRSQRQQVQRRLSFQQRANQELAERLVSCERGVCPDAAALSEQVDSLVAELAKCKGLP